MLASGYHSVKASSFELLDYWLIWQGFFDVTVSKV
jgi:hypothetical protein